MIDIRTIGFQDFSRDPDSEGQVIRNDWWQSFLRQSAYIHSTTSDLLYVQHNVELTVRTYVRDYCKSGKLAWKNIQQI